MSASLSDGDATRLRWNVMARIHAGCCDARDYLKHRTTKRPHANMIGTPVCAARKRTRTSRLWRYRKNGDPARPRGRARRSESRGDDQQERRVVRKLGLGRDRRHAALQWDVAPSSRARRLRV